MADVMGRALSPHAIGSDISPSAPPREYNVRAEARQRRLCMADTISSPRPAWIPRTAHRTTGPVCLGGLMLHLFYLAAVRERKRGCRALEGAVLYLVACDAPRPAAASGHLRRLDVPGGTCLAPELLGPAATRPHCSELTLCKHHITPCPIRSTIWTPSLP